MPAVTVDQAVAAIREALARGAGDDGGVRPELLDVAAAWEVLDGELSRWEVSPVLPQVWGSAVPFPLPEHTLVVGHVSKVHPGLNVEIDAPAGTRVTVHVNDGPAVDLVVPD